MNQDEYTVGNLFQSTDCVSQEMLLQYVQGHLGKPALRKVEMHLVDCPLCEIAVEGIQNQGVESFQNALSNLDSRIKAHQTTTSGTQEDNVIEFRPQVMPPQANNKKNRILPFLGIAASIAILAVVGMLFLGPNSADSIANQHFLMMVEDGTRSLSESDLTKLEMAEANYKAENYAEAGKLFSQVDTAVAQFKAGNCFYLQGNYDQAIGAYQSVIAAQKGWMDHAEMNLAMTYLKLDKIAEARKVLDGLVERQTSFAKQAQQTLDEIQGL